MKEPSKLTQQTFKSAAWLGGTSVVRLGLKLISVAILARLLTPKDYGIVGGALVATQLAAMLYGLGLAPVLVQRKQIDRDHIATAFGASLAIAVIAGAILWFVAPVVAELMHIEPLTQVVRWLAFTTPFGAFRTICEALLARNMRGKQVALQPLICFTISAFFVAIPLAIAGFGYWSLVAMQGADVVIGALVLGIAARRLLACPGFSACAFGDLWPVSLGFLLNQPLAYLGNNGSNFVIARLLGAGSLGLYSRALFLTRNFGRLFNTIARIAIFPSLAHVQDDRERLRRGLVKTLSLVAFATLPASVICVVFAQPIIDLLLGPKWSAAVVPFAILTTMLYWKTGYRSCYAFFQAMGQPYRLARLQGVNAVALVAVVFFGAGYGLDVVCGLVAVVTMMTFLALAVMASKVAGLKLTALLKLHIAPLTLSAAVAGLGIGTRYLLSGAPAIAVVAAGLCVTTTLMLALFHFQPRSVMGDSNDNPVHDLRNIIYARLQKRPLLWRWPNARQS